MQRTHVKVWPVTVAGIPSTSKVAANTYTREEHIWILNVIISKNDDEFIEKVVAITCSVDGVC